LRKVNACAVLPFNPIRYRASRCRAVNGACVK